MNPTTVADLEARFRPLSPSESTVAQSLLVDAWEILTFRSPSLADRLGEGTVGQALVRAVVSAMVLRVLRNPDGVRSWSVDDYSQTRDAALSSGALYVSDDELALVAPSGSASAAFTITPAGSPGALWDPLAGWQ